ncbi:response regulator transcription factor [Sphaerobacter sp.]|uniref:LuxR C-terminal-related transcriptional regulator n=1 Tax=Sphaerobacter sp. TaxID=2099654 RepID=UPI001DEFAA2E|nr:response regulator transcription factor [Sphaerobacter sp.]MBX5446141.1 response regulator transcription factor [Sphaerobacter sp.]
MLRVLVAAAYPTIRAGLAALLDETPDIAVAATVEDVAAAVAEMEPAAPDVILLAPGDDVEEWLDDLARLAGESGAPPVLLLVDTPDLAPEALRAGVAGLLLRDADPDEIVAALRAAGQGLTVLDPRAVPFLTTNSPPQTAPDTGEPLTPREREILQLIAQGLPNKSIALQLGISEHTVKFHVGSILDKLGASSRAEALARAARAGLIVL